MGAVAPFRPEGETLAAGARLGSWMLVAPLGEGGMAEVWAAREIQRGTIVALKVLAPHLADREAMREMFMDEANIATRIDHPNVCRTYALAPLGSFLTIVMEWIDGTSVGHLLRPDDDEHAPKTPLPLRHAVRIVADACAGLHAAHELRDDEGRSLHVVHRDVSPHNILVTRTGVVKVSDFGVAKALGKLHVTLAGHLKGKLPYMSPEHLGGQIDRRSDVFSLGIVLYELTTGQRPFRGENDPQLMAAIARGEFQPPWTLAPGFPAELEQILRQALAVAPSARFPTAQAMGSALEGWLGNGPPIGAQQIAALVEERCGPEIAARAAKVIPPPPPPAPGPAVNAPPPLYSGRRRQQISTLWGSVSVFIGFALGLAVLFFVNASRHARAAVPHRELATSTSAVVSAPSATSPPGTALSPGSASPPGSAPPPPVPSVSSLPTAPPTTTPSAVINVDPTPAPSAKPKKKKPVVVVPPNPYD